MKIKTYIITTILLIVFPLTAFTGEVHFYHTDNFGTPMVMTDINGEVVWRSDELPFGEEYETIESPIKNNRRYLGKEMDEETGFIYMGSRYLNPKTGQFNRPDPVGLVDPATGKVNQEMLLNPQRLKRYTYGLNNPYRYVDPDGNSPTLITGAIGACVGALYNGASNWSQMSGGNWWRSVAVGAGAGFITGATGGLAGAAVGAGLNEVHEQTLRGKDITNYDSKSIVTAIAAGGASHYTGKLVQGIGKEIPKGGIRVQKPSVLKPIDLSGKTYGKAGNILAVPISSEAGRATKKELDD